MVGTASVYGPSRLLAEKHLSRFGVESSWIDTTDLGNLRRAMRPTTRIVYTESQDGNIIRRNKVTGESRTIRPSPANVFPTPPKDEPAYRFHWDTPMILSPIDNGTLLVAANKVFKSNDRGDSWTAISPDLTSGASRDDARRPRRRPPVRAR
jgi:hypothetical protein